MTPSEFVIMEHKAKRAGLHFDLRFKMPRSNMWASFAVPKGVPANPGKKVLAVRTTDHTRKEALLTGFIEDGYGAGQLKKWDGGRCVIMKYSDKHISIDFSGSKVRGTYHFISTVKAGDKDKKSYFLFKSKSINEWKEFNPPPPSEFKNGEKEDSEEGQKYAKGKKLPWSKATIEGCGMISRIPSAGITDEVEEDASEQTTPDLTWDPTPKTVGK
jgi:DNA ligase D-like protein (predicted 3'-phosphoesterase)